MFKATLIQPLLKKVSAVLTCIFITVFTYAQADSIKVSTLQPEVSISEKSLKAIDAKYAGLSSTIDKQTDKLLRRMLKKEDRLRKKLSQTDSTKAAELFTGSADTYQQLQNKLKAPLDKSIANPLKEYVPNLDSLGTAMNYLQKVPGLSPEKLQQVTKVSEQLQQLQAQMQKANEVSDFIRQREQQLKEALAGSGLAKELKGINSEAYYYQQRLAEYKELLKDRKKLLQDVLEGRAGSRVREYAPADGGTIEITGSEQHVVAQGRGDGSERRLAAGGDFVR